MAAASGAPTTRSRIEVEICAQTKSGRRENRMPGARRAMMVVRKFVEAMMPLIAQTMMLIAQKSTPRLWFWYAFSVSGVYPVHPASSACPVKKPQ